jgi:hypothetical protein
MKPLALTASLTTQRSFEMQVRWIAAGDGGGLEAGFKDYAEDESFIVITDGENEVYVDVGDLSDLIRGLEVIKNSLVDDHVIDDTE